MAVLERGAIDEALGALPGWRYDAEAREIAKSFRFRDFSEAFGFMTRVALAAEKADHHPDWANGWNRVDVRLSTHDAKGVTAKDLSLAREMERIAASLAEPAPRD